MRADTVTRAEFDTFKADVTAFVGLTNATIQMLVAQHTANSLMLSALFAILARDTGLDVVALANAIEGAAPTPEAAAHMRQMLRAGPKLVTIAGGKK